MPQGVGTEPPLFDSVVPAFKGFSTPESIATEITSVRAFRMREARLCSTREGLGTKVGDDFSRGEACEEKCSTLEGIATEVTGTFALFRGLPRGAQRPKAAQRKSQCARHLGERLRCAQRPKAAQRKSLAVDRMNARNFKVLNAQRQGNGSHSPTWIPDDHPRVVLNARRHRDGSHQENPMPLPRARECSTPEGIGTEFTFLWKFLKITTAYKGYFTHIRC